jgi:Family of unknown function (DUF6062)
MAMKITRKKRGAAGLWKADVLAKLTGSRCCWVCAHLVNGLDRDFFWFVIEQYYEIGVIDEMRRAYGFCPTHTRHFLETGAHSANVTVFSYVTWYVIKQLEAAHNLLQQRRSKENPRHLCRQVAAALRPQGTCPMCQSLDQTEGIEISALVSALVLTEVKDAYENSPGLCVPHFRQAGYRADWDILVFLSSDLQRRLSAKVAAGRPTTALLEQAVGLDRERSLRNTRLSNRPNRLCDQRTCDSQAYIELGNPAYPWSPTFEQVVTSLAEPSCPVCKACDQGLQNYLAWLAREMETKVSDSSSWDPSWQVCSSHLWELCSSGHDGAAIRIAKHTMQNWLGKLDRLNSGLSKRSSEHWFERLRQDFVTRWRGYPSDGPQTLPRARFRWSDVIAALESPRYRLDALRTIAFREGLCQACWHIQTTTRRRLELILRVLEEPNGREAYQAGWGLCLRHCIDAAKIAEVPSALGEVLSAQVARLRILAWELHEASRKDNWSVRYEPKGPEKDVWRRAAYQFCGV